MSGTTAEGCCSCCGCCGRQEGRVVAAAAAERQLRCQRMGGTAFSLACVAVQGLSSMRVFGPARVAALHAAVAAAVDMVGGTRV